MVTAQTAHYSSIRNEPNRVLSLYQIQPKIYLGITIIYYTVNETKMLGVLTTGLSAAIGKFYDAHRLTNFHTKKLE